MMRRLTKSNTLRANSAHARATRLLRLATPLHAHELAVGASGRGGRRRPVVDRLKRAVGVDGEEAHERPKFCRRRAFASRVALVAQLEVPPRACAHRCCRL